MFPVRGKILGNLSYWCWPAVSALKEWTSVKSLTWLLLVLKLRQHTFTTTTCTNWPLKSRCSYLRMPCVHLLCYCAVIMLAAFAAALLFLKVFIVAILHVFVCKPTVVGVYWDCTCILYMCCFVCCRCPHIKSAHVHVSFISQVLV